MVKRNKGNSHFDLLIRNRKIVKSKCSQEEMIGFVLIIVLVSIIALVFLAISIRKPQGIRESKEVDNFLHSSMLYTTSCRQNEASFYDLRDLIKACYKNEKCLLNEYACEVLNKTLQGLIENSFRIGKEEKYKGYNFKIYEEDKTLIQLDYKAEKSSSLIGSEILLPVLPSSIHIKFELMY